jgi:hypothetical protein
MAAGDYQAAWQQLSPHFQAQLGYERWVNARSSEVFDPVGLEVVARTDSTATVAGGVEVREPGASGGTSRAGRWDLVLVEGAWRLDSSSVGEGAEPEHRPTTRR